MKAHREGEGMREKNPRTLSHSLLRVPFLSLFFFPLSAEDAKQFGSSLKQLDLFVDFAL